MTDTSLQRNPPLLLFPYSVYYQRSRSLSKRNRMQPNDTIKAAILRN